MQEVEEADKSIRREGKVIRVHPVKFHGSFGKNGKESEGTVTALLEKERSSKKENRPRGLKITNAFANFGANCNSFL